MNRTSDESWKFHGALYIKKGDSLGKVCIGAGALLIVFGLLPITLTYIYGSEIRPEDVLSFVAFLSVTVIGIPLLIFGIKKNSAESQRVFLAVFDDHIILFPTNKPFKDSTYDPRDSSGHVRIMYRDVTEYTLYHYSSTDDNGFRTYQNYGDLKISTKDFKYCTLVDNIENVRKILEGYMPVRETMQRRI